MICQALHAWWSTLSPEVQNPTPSSPNFRSNAHLKLCLYLNDIFVGRPFIFSQTTTGITPEATASSPEQTRRPNDNPISSGKSPSPPPPSVPERPRNRAALVERAVEAAINTIALLRTLHETTGLARSSYTEFSSCRAALLVMLAQSVVSPAPGSSVQQPTPQQQSRLKAAVEMGMKLIRRMAAGNNVSTQSEASIIEALETAVRRLHAMQDMRGAAGGIAGEGRGETFVEINVRGEMDVGKTGYERFKEWASMWPATTIGGGGGGEPSQPQHQHHRQVQSDDPMGGLKRLDGRALETATVPSPYPGMPSGPGVLGPPPELVEHSPDSARWMAIMDNAGLRMEQLDDMSLFGGFPELGALDGWPGLI